MTTYDLHAHSTASDGKLKPAELINLAADSGVQTLALTDHDTTQGLHEAKTAAQRAEIRFIPGIEVSTTWNDKCFHIVGLGIKAQHQLLKEGIKHVQDKRFERARLIAHKLENYGIAENIFDSVKKSAGNGMITRTHFAQYLMAKGYGATLKDIFKNFLVRGKPGYVNVHWAELDEAIEWINAAGGVAVVAHPMRYGLTASWMKRFLSAFKAAHGKGIEVVCASNNKQETRNSAALARHHGLAGSVGSDFHSPENRWTSLGRLANLPDGIEPIWSYFS